MHFRSFALAGLVPSATLAAGIPGRFGCGTDEPSRQHLQITQELAAEEAVQALSGNLTTRATINVDVYFHVLAASTSVADGYVSVCDPILFPVSFFFFHT